MIQDEAETYAAESRVRVIYALESTLGCLHQGQHHRIKAEDMMSPRLLVASRPTSLPLDFLQTLLLWSGPSVQGQQVTSSLSPPSPPTRYQRACLTVLPNTPRLPCPCTVPLPCTCTATPEAVLGRQVLRAARSKVEQEQEARRLEQEAGGDTIKLLLGEVRALRLQLRGRN